MFDCELLYYIISKLCFQGNTDIYVHKIFIQKSYKNLIIDLLLSYSNIQHQSCFAKHNKKLNGYL